ncbi:MAG: hypothetical protein M1829_004026 [Trizodia sp. TS-e1964]|nr:MAG: hypothetical protein M1829_004026 [Trizodia sp. TS-e1964]
MSFHTACAHAARRYCPATWRAEEAEHVLRSSAAHEPSMRNCVALAHAMAQRWARPVDACDVLALLLGFERTVYRYRMALALRALRAMRGE